MVGTVRVGPFQVGPYAPALSGYAVAGPMTSMGLSGRVNHFHRAMIRLPFAGPAPELSSRSRTALSGHRGWHVTLADHARHQPRCLV